MSTAATFAPTSELGDGIAQIRLPMTGNPLRYVNGYVVDEEDGLTLVDCGWRADDVLDALHAGLHALGHTLADVRRILITHHHFDHYGLAGTLRRAGVPELLMHERDWHRAQHFGVTHEERERQSDAWLARNGFIPHELDDESFASRWEASEPTRFVADGERVGRLEAVWTPGHAPGHLCFIDTRSGRMLTGDHVLTPITPHVGLWREDDGDPLADYLASLAKVRGRGPGGALPAHGEPFADLDGRLAELIAHTEAREAQVLSALDAGAASAGEVAARLPWTRRERAFATLEEFHQQFAVAETIAHLQYLRSRALVTRSEGTLTLYSRAAASTA